MYHINYIYNHMGLQGGREPKILKKLKLCYYIPLCLQNLYQQNFK